MDNKESRLSFNYNSPEHDEEDVSLDFYFNECVTNSLNLYHDFCKRFAAAMGYADSSIERVFGETQYNL